MRTGRCRYYWQEHCWAVVSTLFTRPAAVRSIVPGMPLPHLESEAVAGLAGTVTGGWAFGAAGGGFLAGAAAGGIGTATDMYLQSLGNHAYFGEPIISTKDLLVGAAFGAITAGAINGSVAAYEGKNYWTGEMIAEGKGTFSFNNPRINGLQKEFINRRNGGNLKTRIKAKKI